jgi:hypothetical protein
VVFVNCYDLLADDARTPSIGGGGLVREGVRYSFAESLAYVHGTCSLGNILKSRVSEMAFSLFWGRFQMTTSTIETALNHPQQLSPAMANVTNQLFCIYTGCWAVLNI